VDDLVESSAQTGPVPNISQAQLAGAAQSASCMKEWLLAKSAVLQSLTILLFDRTIPDNNIQSKIRQIRQRRRSR
jgi:hypothetical protein